MSLSTWLVIAGLLAVNGLYVAAEFAAVSVRRSRVRQLAEEGNGLARRLLPVVEDTRELDRYVAVCQVGITLSSLVLGAYGQAQLAGWLGPRLGSVGASEAAAAGVVLVGLTGLQVVLGELVPKSLALQFPVASALYTVLPMRWSGTLFGPLTTVLNGSGLLVLRALGVRRTGERHLHDPDELELLIAESRGGGLLPEREHLRLQRALRLGRRSVRELMVPRTRVAVVDLDAPEDATLRAVLDGRFTRLPVVQGSLDRVVGLLHVKEYVAAFVERGGPPPLADLLRPVVTVPETMTADLALTTLRERHAQLAVVMGERGGAEGIVTLVDVLRALFGDVGDVPDESGAAEVLPDGRLRLPGRMGLQEAASWVRDAGGVAEFEGFGAEVATTVAGFAMEALGHVPREGERVRVDGVSLVVEEVRGRTIRYVVVEGASRVRGRGGGAPA